MDTDSLSYTVGITIFVKADGTLGLYENGLKQNVLFLYKLFKASPNCKAVYLLNHGEAELTEDLTAYGIEPQAVVRTESVLDQLTHVIGLGAAMDRPTAEKLKAQGARMILYKGGNGGVISMEAMAQTPPASCAEPYTDWDFWDVVWMTPQHIHTYKSWCETVYRVPVVEIPQIWSPMLIRKEGFGFKKPDKWRVGIMDPNNTVMKTSHLPMLVCERAYRHSPEQFKAIYVSNSHRWKGNIHFESFAGSMDSVKAGILTSEERFIASHFLADHCDAIVTHQWENGLNYLYYEVLYGNYPLIHNSPFLKDYGYYYDSFDAESGAQALLLAMKTHTGWKESDASWNAELFERLNPENPKTIALHENLM